MKCASCSKKFTGKYVKGAKNYCNDCKILIMYAIHEMNKK